ncbi:MAG: hypothetical protein RIF39_01240 [Cyclobacteriaceae bacterium]
MKTPIEKTLDEISESLVALKEKSTSKWFVPLLVAVISFGSNLAGIAIQNYYAAPKIYQQAIAQERAEFRQKGLDIVLSVDSSFKKYCTHLNEEDKIEVTSSLEALHNYVERLDAFGVTKSQRVSVQDYNNYVAEKYHEMSVMSTTTDNANTFYKNSRFLFENAKSSIGQIIDI